MADSPALAAESAPLTPAAVHAPAFAGPNLELRARVARLALAFGSALLISALTLFQPAGLGWSLAVAVVAATWVALARMSKRSLRTQEMVVLALMVVVGAFFTVRVSPWLVTYNALAVTGLALLLPLFARRDVAFFNRLRPEGMRRELGRTLVGVAVGPFAEVGATLDAAQGAYDRERALPVLRGLFFGGIAAAVFVSLFASADADFNALLGHLLFEVDATKLVRLLTVGAWFFVTVGLFMAGRRRRWRAGSFRARQVSAAGAITALGLVNFVFGAFVLVQVGKALGITGVLHENPSAISDAAREGFFQLLWVVGLVFALVLGLDRRLAPAQRSRVVVGAQLTLLALTGAVAGTALLRMYRYTEMFGLTELRFHSTAFMFLLVTFLGWMAFTLVRGRRGSFVGVAATAATTFVLALNLMNPDGLIAAHNMARCDLDNSELDREHLFTLSADAIPDNDALPDDVAIYTWEYGAADERELLRNGGWRAFNLARERAAEVAAPAAR